MYNNKKTTGKLKNSNIQFGAEFFSQAQFFSLKEISTGLS